MCSVTKQADHAIAETMIGTGTTAIKMKAGLIAVGTIGKAGMTRIKREVASSAVEVAATTE